MLVTRAKAEEAWAILVGTARAADEVWDTIFLDTATETNIKDAYRTAARYTHPDTGGSSEAFARVDWAKHVLLAWIGKAKPAATDPHRKRPCDRCGGFGYTILPSSRPGSTGLRRQCPKCRGSGDADFDAA